MATLWIKTFLILDKKWFLKIIRNIMPRPSPPLSNSPAAQLQELGARIRAQRKALRISAIATAEASGVSRVTLHRIEKGEPSVTMGGWFSVMAALGLHLQVTEQPAQEAGPLDRTAWLPVRIALADYPQLRALAWQVQGTEALTPREAFDIYERNARHLDMKALTPAERDLRQVLQRAFTEGPDHV